MSEKNFIEKIAEDYEMLENALSPEELVERIKDKSNQAALLKIIRDDKDRYKDVKI